eukprot:scaffold97472_cov23-Phaeocystis_antarctica.AAC.1
MAKALELLARLLELEDDVFERRRLDIASTDAVQHAEGGQPLDQIGAVDLGERRLLPELGALAGPERADVGGESRLLLGRAVAVLEGLLAVGRGRLIVHRLAEAEKEC